MTQKFAVAGKTFTVKVKQINLNGYIHNTDATVTFEAKEVATDKVEVEGNVTARTHPVQLNATHPTTGADMQVENITKAQILEALKIQAGTEAAIHFDHVNAGWTPAAGKAFYYTADNDVKELAEVGSATKLLDSNGNFAGVQVKFATGYDITKFKNEDAGDFLTNGKTLYIPVVLTGTDNQDLNDQTEYTYTVNVPVKFQMPATKDLFSWKDVAGTFRNNLGVAQSVPSINTLALPAAGNTTSVAGVSYAAVAPNYNLVEGSTTNVESITPAVTVEVDYQNMQSYKKAKAKLDELVITSTVPTDALVFGGTIQSELFNNAATVDKDNLEKAYKNLVDLYKKNVVKPTYRVAPSSDYYFIWDTDSRGWKTTLYSTANPPATPTTKATVEGWLSDGYNVMYTTENYSFKVKGMHISVLGRTIGIDDVTVNNVYTAAANFTATLSYNKYISETGAPTLNFYNANLPVVDKSNFVGSFSVTDKYDMPLVFDNAGIGNVGTTYNFSSVSATLINADGIETPISAITTANVQLVVYASEKNSDGTVSV